VHDKMTFIKHLQQIYESLETERVLTYLDGFLTGLKDPILQNDTERTNACEEMFQMVTTSFTSFHTLSSIEKEIAQLIDIDSIYEQKNYNSLLKQIIKHEYLNNSSVLRSSSLIVHFVNFHKRLRNSLNLSKKYLIPEKFEMIDESQTLTLQIEMGSSTLSFDEIAHLIIDLSKLFENLIGYAGFQNNVSTDIVIIESGSYLEIIVQINELVSSIDWGAFFQAISFVIGTPWAATVAYSDWKNKRLDTKLKLIQLEKLEEERSQKESIEKSENLLASADKQNPYYHKLLNSLPHLLKDYDFIPLISKAEFKQLLEKAQEKQIQEAPLARVELIESPKESESTEREKKEETESDSES